MSESYKRYASEKYVDDKLDDVNLYNISKNLEEETQMAIRKNLGLHNSYTDYKCICENTSINSLVETSIGVNISSYSNNIYVKIYKVVSGGEAETFYLERKSSYDFGTDLTIAYYGNPYLLKYIDTEDTNNWCSSVGVVYNGIPIVIYGDTIVLDEAKLSSQDRYGVYEYSIHNADQLITVYEHIPEEYIPDTIARTYDIPNMLIQSDWNQTDGSSLDYINNKTHYIEIEEVRTSIGSYGPDGVGYAWDLYEKFSIDNNDAIYIEIWDVNPEQINSSYSLNVQSAIGSTESGGSRFIKWYGNINIARTYDNEVLTVTDLLGYTSETEYSDIPFALYEVCDEDNNISAMRLIINSTLEPLYWIGFRVDVYRLEKTEIYHQLDERYIPDTIARTYEISNIETSITEYIDTSIESVSEVLENKYDANNPPPYPVTSVNGKTGDITFKTEEWTFTLSDGTTVTKKVLIEE